MTIPSPSDVRLTRIINTADVFNTGATKPNQHQAQRKHSPLIGERQDAGVAPTTPAEKVRLLTVVLTYCFLLIWNKRCARTERVISTLLFGLLASPDSR